MRHDYERVVKRNSSVVLLHFFIGFICSGMRIGLNLIVDFSCALVYSSKSSYSSCISIYDLQYSIDNSS